MRQLLSSSPSQRPSCEELLALPLLQPAVAAARDLVASKQVRRWPRWLCCLLVKETNVADSTTECTAHSTACDVRSERDTRYSSCTVLS